jgi:hypothetical protein
MSLASTLPCTIAVKTYFGADVIDTLDIGFVQIDDGLSDPILCIHPCHGTTNTPRCITIIEKKKRTSGDFKHIIWNSMRQITSCSDDEISGGRVIRAAKSTSMLLR